MVKLHHFTKYRSKINSSTRTEAGMHHLTSLMIGDLEQL